MNNETVYLGYLEHGTGKHMSNTVYFEGGGTANIDSDGIALDRYRMCDRISYCIDANYAKGTSFEYFIKKHRRQLVIEEWQTM